MANPLYQQLNKFAFQNQQNMRSNGNSFTNLINNFNTFRQNFQGDPKQIVQGMLQNGQMSQQQFQQLGQMANEFMKLLPK